MRELACIPFAVGPEFRTDQDILAAAGSIRPEEQLEDWRGKEVSKEISSYTRPTIRHILFNI